MKRKALWAIDFLLGIDGKPSIRNILALLLAIRLLLIKECDQSVNDIYIQTLALLITALLGLKVADHFIAKKHDNDNPPE